MYLYLSPGRLDEVTFRFELPLLKKVNKRQKLCFLLFSCYVGVCVRRKCSLCDLFYCTRRSGCPVVVPVQGAGDTHIAFQRYY